MQRSNEDDAWRAIVDNYGDRADIGPAEAKPEPEPEPAEPTPPPAQQATWEDPYPDADWSQDRFVPPPPPPVPSTSKDRLIAWIGIFGSPAVLLVCLVLGIDLPQLLAYLLVAGFVGGFLYLVWQMPSGPRDPDD
ncbi:MAG: hypothetical protein WKF79_14320, partial [Nocardioides sp.]